MSAILFTLAIVMVMFNAVLLQRAIDAGRTEATLRSLLTIVLMACFAWGAARSHRR